MTKDNSKNHRKRLRERFIQAGSSTLSEQMLLELLLTYAIPRKDVQPIANDLIDKFENFPGVLNASIEGLSTVKGLGENSAILIKLIEAIQFHIASEVESSVTEDQTSGGSYQRSLFENDETGKVSEDAKDSTKETTKARKAFRRRGVELFANALMKETISVLPDLPDTDSIVTARQAIRDNLHFSAESTRRRNSLYIVQRMFPEGFVDRPLKLFANQFKDRDEFKEVCFYRFLKSEPLLGKLVGSLMIPNIGVGYLQRNKVDNYLELLFPSLKSIKSGTKAFVNALVNSGTAKLNSKKIVFSYRNIPFASFVFVLFSEFPEPGMYELSQIENNSHINHMLWKQDQILPMAYELRNKGFISKISEIDSFRQFTTKLNLEQAVELLISLSGKK